MSDNNVTTCTAHPEVEILKRAKEIIAEPEHWTTKAAARDHLNRECSSLASFACRWCLVGAIQRAALEQMSGREFVSEYEPYWKARHLAIDAAEALGFGARTEGSTPLSAAVDANDNGGFTTVHKVLDRGIYMGAEG